MQNDTTPRPQNDKTETGDISKLYGFVGQFPANMHSLVHELAQGQLLTDKVFAQNGELKTAQHPHYAVSTGSRPSGHERFSVGLDRAGETLVYRTMDSQWLDHRLLTTPTTAAFFDLVGLKGIPYIIHTKGSKSELLDLAYHYWSGEKDILLDRAPILEDYVKSRSLLFRQVSKRGVAFYADHGVPMSGDPHEDFKRSMAVQQLVWDMESAPGRATQPAVAAIYVDEQVGDHLYFSPKTRQFTRIDPDADHDDLLAELVDRCPAYYKGSEGQDPRAAKETYCQHLLEGMQTGVYLHHQALPSLLAKSTGHGAYIISCSDSRSPASIIAGEAEDAQRWTLRTPGAFMTDDRGQPYYECELFLAVAAEHEHPVVHTHHSTCGAMGVTEAFCSGSSLFEIGFQSMALEHQALYDRVMGRGTTPEEICAYYTERTGIPVDNVVDCFGLQQLKWDINSIAKTGRFPPVSAVYQHMRLGQNYLYNPNLDQKDKKKFLPIPTTKDYGASPQPPHGTHSTTRVAPRV